MDISYSWEEIIGLLKAYKRAVEADNEEDIVHITSVLPNEIQIWGDSILIKI